MAGAAALGFSLPAGADTTCYTGCTPTPPGIVELGPATTPGVPNSHAATPLPTPTESVPGSGGLPLTGADIEQSVAVAGVLLVAGAVMVRTKRRRPRTTR